MLNVKTLTDTMSRMQLPDLQKYAALHKNDPYIVTLALSIANQKKQMMASKDGQAGMQPQPTVVDQDIFGIPLEPQPRGAVPPQQALPEDQGIGQLPAPNMQNMAEGGIVAFDDGGSVPGYAGGGQPDPKQVFAAKYRDAAFAAGQALGVDPGIIISQWGVETRWGQSKKPTQVNNLGNIKAGANWKGPTITQHDKTEKSNDRYRSYDSIDAFVKDYVNLIKTKYPEAVGAGADAAKFATGLRPGKQGGYATDKNYASTLVSTAKTLPPLVPIDSAQAAQASRKDLGLAPNETAAQPTAASQTVDRSIPAGYKEEQAAQQAAQQPVYDADVKQLQKEGFVDKTKRVGRGLYGLGEAGTNFLGQLTTYPTAAIASAIDNPSAAYAATQGKPGSDAFYKGMTDRQSEAIYDPRTPEGQYYNEIKDNILSGISPYVGHMVSGRPTSIKAAPFTRKNPKQVKPGLPGLKEAQEAKVEPKVGDQLPLFPELETARTAPAAAPAAAYPPGIFGRNQPEPVQAAPQRPAIATEIKPDAIPEDVGGVRPGVERGAINPQDAGLAAAARNKIALEQAADVAAKQEAARGAEEAVKPTEVISPKEVAKEPTMSVAEQLDRARAYELQKQKESVIRNRQTAVQAGLPGAAQALPAQPVEENVQGLAPNENIDESVFDPTYGGKLPLPEKVIVDKLEDKTGKSSEELKKQADSMGMDWNSFLVRFGLGLMAGESQYASVNVGKAGLGALDAQLAEQKAKQAQALNLSESELKKMQAKYYGSYADAIERGAKEKNEALQAETLVQQRMEKWLSGPGKFAETIERGATAREEERVRKAIYQQLGIKPTMTAGAPTGGAKFLGFEKPV